MCAVRVPPPLLALAAGYGQRLLTKGAAPPRAAQVVAAVATGAASVGLLASAGLTFRSRETTVDPLRPERATSLVVSGPFKLTRNPMYVGMAGLLVAHAVLRGSPRAVLPVAAWVAVIDRVQIPPEERAMAKLFGADYEAYRSRVPRWLIV